MRMRSSDLAVVVATDPVGAAVMHQFVAEHGAPRDAATNCLSHVGPDLAASTTWLGALDESGAILGGLRVLRAGHAPLPLVANANLDDDARARLDELRGQLSQIADLTIAPGAPTLAVTRSLLRALVQQAVATGAHSYLVAEMSASLIRALRAHVAVEAEIIGTARRHGRAESNDTELWPVFVDGVQWLHDLRFADHALWAWFTDELVVSLTDAPQANPSVRSSRRDRR